ncbi:beta-ketoacyl-ACP reductase [Paenibacillus baekrokdamisoli]|uniref:Beta-ketoacyl-ACP reductase n=1 Tax=Paenibacillus baekrokdamisoli TaxID=1712516 RepID=A0A3G9JIB2_9BACL|nr:SDR family oxidoreductase [Paenibacillus baekrokdamisoli]MBB3072119.1 3-oxoacyl-[acyl-carrier protein] reductase [Paenibacillus baekrokdamisoli]BBH24703.1 beta-ketoacyl-ACP reductase [Paenibacillus baekrokdamisoli]
MHIDLSGRTVLITGATGELGRVMARTLANCGANLVIHYLQNEAKAKQLKEETEKLGVQAVMVQADITNEQSVFRMKEQAEHAMEKIDIVVANAVIQYEWTTILNQSPQDYESQFQSCILQNVYLAKAFVPGMIDRKYGRIIGINTECSMLNNSNQSAYVAGKRGMDGLYRVLAKEVGEHQITVNQVAPGWTISDRDRKNGTVQRSEYEAGVPLRRRGEDQDIANTVAFLASDLAGFITGAYIPVCGGNIMPAI